MVSGGMSPVPGKDSIWQTAPVSQSASVSQMSAQYLAPEEASVRAHFGAAVQPSGTSVGQGELVLQLGEQKVPCQRKCKAEHV